MLLNRRWTALLTVKVVYTTLLNTVLIERDKFLKKVREERLKGHLYLRFSAERKGMQSTQRYRTKGKFSFRPAWLDVTVGLFLENCNYPLRSKYFGCTMNDSREALLNYSSSQFQFVLKDDAPVVPSDGSEFDRLLIKSWNKAKKLGVFKYDLNLLFKSLPGKYGLTAQLNCERAKHRRKPHHFKSIKDTFDARRFNFSKIDHSEILMKLHKEDQENTTIIGQTTCKNNDVINDSYLIINNSPMGPGHSLLIPSLNGSLPQILTLYSIRLAVEIMLMSSCRYFHIVFNSILALASVNHLHLHAYYWPYRTKLIEWPQSQLCPGINLIKDWILPCFVVQLLDKDLDGFVWRVHKIIDYLTLSETPHNVFVARAPKWRTSDSSGIENSKSSQVQSESLYVTFYIFPRKPLYGTKPITTLAPASCEMGGHVLVYNTWAFQELNEEKVVRIMSEEAKLDQDQFDAHCQRIRSLFTSSI
uniref:GDP-D-glucose phosphorylase 1 n=2 Tax=Romanomermis culicivorax TaxID=13658 RepID=A0A915J6S9_ROMCU